MASATQLRDSRLNFSFVGWIRRGAVANLLDHTDLLALPSTWPEPFGLVGLEEGLRGVPTAAFRAGGIPEWLRDGVNGHLAPSDPPTAIGLADAIVKCLRDPSDHARLSHDAQERAFSPKKHLEELSTILVRVAERTPDRPP
jgi:glycosyltransferase involved in cell wall biosynthesis